MQRWAETGLSEMANQAISTQFVNQLAISVKVDGLNWVLNV